MKRRLLVTHYISAIIAVALVIISPRLAFAHLVNSSVGEFYSGMLHPVTSPEHLLLLAALALLASQCGKNGARSTILRENVRNGVIAE